MEFFKDIFTLLTRYDSFFIQGIGNTLIIAFFSVILGIVSGTLMATMRLSSVKPCGIWPRPT